MPHVKDFMQHYGTNRREHEGRTRQRPKKVRKHIHTDNNSGV
jgi:hypothetical protein